MMRGQQREMNVEFSTLTGKTLVRVQNIDDERIEFETADGDTFALFHRQDCCESVRVESVVGDLADLIGTPILLAEEATSKNDPKDVAEAKATKRAADPESYYDYTDSQTWTFYKLR